MEAGAGGLELDVHMTRDGQIVVIHDATVDRTTNGSGAVSEMTLDELRGFDAGHNFSPDGGPARPYRGRGVRVPTLGEVLEEFPGVAVNIDIKAGTSWYRGGGLRGLARGGRLGACPRGLHPSRYREAVP